VSHGATELVEASSVKLKIAAWNVEGRLARITTSGRGSPEHILTGITRLEADILVLPEAYVGEPAAGVDEQLRTLGYSWRDVRYEDKDEVLPHPGRRPQLRVLSKLPILSVEVVRYGGIRNHLIVTVKVPVLGRQLRVMPIHLDDRRENWRMQQLSELIPRVNQSTLPTIMMGDFNAMWPTRRARLLRSRGFQRLIAMLPTGPLKDIFTRLRGMATGTTMQHLQAETLLREVDPRRRATVTPKMYHMSWMPSIRLVQLDHIFISHDLGVEDFMVSGDGGADHRAVSAMITLLK
jgi:endonuclease/exonuclease/phosphatase family metal-dependent hydrolase